MSAQSMVPLMQPPPPEPVSAESSATAAKRLAVASRWAKPDARQRQSECMKRSWANPAQRSLRLVQMSRRARERWEDPERRRRHSELMKALWADPAKRADWTERMRAARARRGRR